MIKNMMASTNHLPLRVLVEDFSSSFSCDTNDPRRVLTAAGAPALADAVRVDLLMGEATAASSA